MTDIGEMKARHAEAARVAFSLYVESKASVESSGAWHAALASARSRISDALRASNFLGHIGSALEDDGRHMRVFRHVLAPPISQDQFQIICPAWRKATEKEGRRVAPSVAAQVGAMFEKWRDKRLTIWLARGGPPTSREIRRLFDSIAPLLASQEFGTFERNHSASVQEKAVVALLKEKGWFKEPSRLVDTRASIAPRHFMHKTRFATTTRPQEVDIACGLKDTFVLAMECKVTNDVTNSVKRVNDVLKKANAWREHWGSFVKTAALLQGVIAARDVDRLVDAGIYVFWSHDLAHLDRWLDEQL